MTRFMLALFVWLIPTWAYASEGILLFESELGRKGLCAAVRIQMADEGNVTCLGTKLPSDTAQRLERASAIVRERDARIGLIIERDPNPNVLRMVIVGARPDQAVLAVERIEDRGGPDVDRALALKAREAHDVVLVTERNNKNQSAPLAATLVAPTAKPVPENPAPNLPARNVNGFAGTGFGLSVGDATAPAISALLGLSMDEAHIRLEANIEGAFLFENEARRANTRIAVSEWDVGIQGRILYRRENMAFGASLGLFASLLDVFGEDRPMRHKTVWLVSPQALAALDARVCLWDRLWVRLIPELDLALRRERVASEGDVLIDRGRVRARFVLGLLFEVP